jgi:hypothetical protein
MADTITDPIQRHLDRVADLYGKGKLSRPTDTTADVIIIGCAKSKLTTDDRVPAAQLYTSQLFNARRAYAGATGKPWYILSAKHGLVHPEQLIPPYDLEISELDHEQYADLAFAVARKIRLLELDGATIELHAGAEYADLLIDNSYLPDVTVTLPMRGKQIGEQLSEYKQILSDGNVSHRSTNHPSHKEHVMATATKARKSSKTTSRKTAIKAKAKVTPANKLYQGAPIPASRLFYRKMTEFKNIDAWAWMAISEQHGTVTYGNSYGPDFGQFRASYDPSVYTYPIKEKVVAKRMEIYRELDDVTEWPSFFTTAGPTKRRGRKSK